MVSIHIIDLMACKHACEHIAFKYLILVIDSLWTYQSVISHKEVTQNHNPLGFSQW